MSKTNQSIPSFVADLEDLPEWDFEHVLLLADAALIKIRIDLLMADLGAQYDSRAPYKEFIPDPEIVSPHTYKCAGVCLGRGWTVDGQHIPDWWGIGFKKGYSKPAAHVSKKKAALRQYLVCFLYRAPDDDENSQFEQYTIIEGGHEIRGFAVIPLKRLEGETDLLRFWMITTWRLKAIAHMVQNVYCLYRQIAERVPMPFLPSAAETCDPTLWQPALEQLVTAFREADGAQDKKVREDKTRWKIEVKKSSLRERDKAGRTFPAIRTVCLYRAEHMNAPLQLHAKLGSVLDGTHLDAESKSVLDSWEDWATQAGKQSSLMSFWLDAQSKLISDEKIDVEARSDIYTQILDCLPPPMSDDQLRAADAEWVSSSFDPELLAILIQAKEL